MRPEPGARSATPIPEGSHQGSPRVFWAGAVIGGAIIAWGAAGLIADNGAGVTGTRLVPWLAWLFGALVVHDAVIVPLTMLAGRATRRARPLVIRTPLQVALALTGVVTLYAVPLLLGYGRGAQPGNASVQPLNYRTSWLVVVALVWLAAAALAGWPALRGRVTRRLRSPGRRSTRERG